MKAILDPDIPSGYSDELTAYVDLYDSTNHSIITNVLNTYYLYGNSVDYLIIDLGLFVL
ncbi:MAG: hypothetical protein ACFFFH_04830 [Candidatus Thorarchaeota archaeon]